MKVAFPQTVCLLLPGSAWSAEQVDNDPKRCGELSAPSHDPYSVPTTYHLVLAIRRHLACGALTAHHIQPFACAQLAPVNMCDSAEALWN